MASSNRECASEDAHIFSVNMERADVSSCPVVVGGGGGDSIIRAIPNSFTMSTPFPSESSRATGQSSNPARSRPLPKVVRAARAAGGIVRIPLIVGRGVKGFLVEALVEGPLWARALNLVLMVVIVVLVLVLFGDFSKSLAVASKHTSALQHQLPHRGDIAVAPNEDAAPYPQGKLAGYLNQYRRDLDRYSNANRSGVGSAHIGDKNAHTEGEGIGEIVHHDQMATSPQNGLGRMHAAVHDESDTEIEVDHQHDFKDKKRKSEGAADSPWWKQVINKGSRLLHLGDNAVNTKGPATLGNRMDGSSSSGGGESAEDFGRDYEQNQRDNEAVLLESYKKNIEAVRRRIDDLERQGRLAINNANGAANDVGGVNHDLPSLVNELRSLRLNAKRLQYQLSAHTRIEKELDFLEEQDKHRDWKHEQQRQLWADERRAAEGGGKSEVETVQPSAAPKASSPSSGSASPASCPGLAISTDPSEIPSEIATPFLPYPTYELIGLEVAEFAYVTFVTSHTYVQQAATLMYSIAISGSVYSRCVLTSKGALSKRDQRTLSLFARVIEVDAIPSPLYISNPQYVDTFTKLRIWELEPLYRKVLYVDSDVIIKKSLDHLFDIDAPWVVPMDAEQNRYSTGMMLLEPSLEMFDKMMASLKRDVTSDMMILPDLLFLKNFFENVMPQEARADNEAVMNLYREAYNAWKERKAAFDVKVDAEEKEFYAEKNRREAAGGGSDAAYDSTGAYRSTYYFRPRFTEPPPPEPPKSSMKPLSYVTLMSRWYQVYQEEFGVHYASFMSRRRQKVTIHDPRVHGIHYPGGTKPWAGDVDAKFKRYAAGFCVWPQYQREFMMGVAVRARRFSPEDELFWDIRKKGEANAYNYWGSGGDKTKRQQEQSETRIHNQALAHVNRAEGAALALRDAVKPPVVSAGNQPRQPSRDEVRAIMRPFDFEPAFWWFLYYQMMLNSLNALASSSTSNDILNTTMVATLSPTAYAKSLEEFAEGHLEHVQFEGIFGDDLRTSRRRQARTVANPYRSNTAAQGPALDDSGKRVRPPNAQPPAVANADAYFSAGINADDDARKQGQQESGNNAGEDEGGSDNDGGAQQNPDLDAGGELTQAEVRKIEDALAALVILDDEKKAILEGAQRQRDNVRDINRMDATYNKAVNNYYYRANSRAQDAVSSNEGRANSKSLEGTPDADINVVREAVAAYLRRRRWFTPKYPALGLRSDLARPLVSLLPRLGVRLRDVVSIYRAYTKTESDVLDMIRAERRRAAEVAVAGNRNGLNDAGGGSANWSPAPTQNPWISNFNQRTGYGGAVANSPPWRNNNIQSSQQQAPSIWEDEWRAAPWVFYLNRDFPDLQTALAADLSTSDTDAPSFAGTGSSSSSVLAATFAIHAVHPSKASHVRIPRLDLSLPDVRQRHQHDLPLLGRREAGGDTVADFVLKVDLPNTQLLLGQNHERGEGLSVLQSGGVFSYVYSRESWKLIQRRLLYPAPTNPAQDDPLNASSATKFTTAARSLHGQEVWGQSAGNKSNISTPPHSRLGSSESHLPSNMSRPIFTFKFPFVIRAPALSLIEATMKKEGTPTLFSQRQLVECREKVFTNTAVSVLGGVAPSLPPSGIDRLAVFAVDVGNLERVLVSNSGNPAEDVRKEPNGDTNLNGSITHSKDEAPGSKEQIRQFANVVAQGWTNCAQDFFKRDLSNAFSHPEANRRRDPQAAIVNWWNGLTSTTGTTKNGDVPTTTTAQTSNPLVLFIRDVPVVSLGTNQTSENRTSRVSLVVRLGAAASPSSLGNVLLTKLAEGLSTSPLTTTPPPETTTNYWGGGWGSAGYNRRVPSTHGGPIEYSISVFDEVPAGQAPPSNANRRSIGGEMYRTPGPTHATPSSKGVAASATAALVRLAPFVEVDLKGRYIVSGDHPLFEDIDLNYPRSYPSAEFEFVAPRGNESGDMASLTKRASSLRRTLRGFYQLAGWWGGRAPATHDMNASMVSMLLMERGSGIDVAVTATTSIDAAGSPGSSSAWSSPASSPGVASVRGTAQQQPSSVAQPVVRHFGVGPTSTTADTTTASSSTFRLLTLSLAQAKMRYVTYLRNLRAANSALCQSLQPVASSGLQTSQRNTSGGVEHDKEMPTIVRVSLNGDVFSCVGRQHLPSPSGDANTTVTNTYLLRRHLHRRTNVDATGTSSHRHTAIAPVGAPVSFEDFLSSSVTHTRHPLLHAAVIPRGVRASPMVMDAVRRKYPLFPKTTPLTKMASSNDNPVLPKEDFDLLSSRLAQHILGAPFNSTAEIGGGGGEFDDLDAHDGEGDEAIPVAVLGVAITASSPAPAKASSSSSTSSNVFTLMMGCSLNFNAPQLLSIALDDSAASSASSSSFVDLPESLLFSYTPVSSDGEASSLSPVVAASDGSPSSDGSSGVVWKVDGSTADDTTTQTSAPTLTSNEKGLRRTTMGKDATFRLQLPHGLSWLDAASLSVTILDDDEPMSVRDGAGGKTLPSIRTGIVGLSASPVTNKDDSDASRLSSVLASVSVRRTKLDSQLRALRNDIAEFINDTAEVVSMPGGGGGEHRNVVSYITSNKTNWTSPWSPSVPPMTVRAPTQSLLSVLLSQSLQELKLRVDDALVQPVLLLSQRLRSTSAQIKVAISNANIMIRQSTSSDSSWLLSNALETLQSVNGSLTTLFVDADYRRGAMSSFGPVIEASPSLQWLLHPSERLTSSSSSSRLLDAADMVRTCESISDKLSSKNRSTVNVKRALTQLNSGDEDTNAGYRVEDAGLYDDGGGEGYDATVKPRTSGGGSGSSSASSTVNPAKEHRVALNLLRESVEYLELHVAPVLERHSLVFECLSQRLEAIRFVMVRRISFIGGQLDRHQRHQRHLQHKRSSQTMASPSGSVFDFAANSRTGNVMERRRHNGVLISSPAACEVVNAVLESIGAVTATPSSSTVSDDDNEVVTTGLKQAIVDSWLRSQWEVSKAVALGGGINAPPLDEKIPRAVELDFTLWKRQYLKGASTATASSSSSPTTSSSFRDDVLLGALSNLSRTGGVWDARDAQTKARRANEERLRSEQHAITSGIHAHKAFMATLLPMNVTAINATIGNTTQNGQRPGGSGLEPKEVVFLGERPDASEAGSDSGTEPAPFTTKYASAQNRHPTIPSTTVAAAREGDDGRYVLIPLDALSVESSSAGGRPPTAPHQPKQQLANQGSFNNVLMMGPSSNSGGDDFNDGKNHMGGMDDQQEHEGVHNARTTAAGGHHQQRPTSPPHMGGMMATTAENSSSHASISSSSSTSSYHKHLKKQPLQNITVDDLIARFINSTNVTSDNSGLHIDNAIRLRRAKEDLAELALQEDEVREIISGKSLSTTASSQQDNKGVSIVASSTSTKLVRLYDRCQKVMSLLKCASSTGTTAKVTEEQLRSSWGYSITSPDRQQGFTNNDIWTPRLLTVGHEPTAIINCTRRHPDGATEPLSAILERAWGIFLRTKDARVSSSLNAQQADYCGVVGLTFDVQKRVRGVYDFCDSYIATLREGRREAPYEDASCGGGNSKPSSTTWAQIAKQGDGVFVVGSDDEAEGGVRASLRGPWGAAAAGGRGSAGNAESDRRSVDAIWRDVIAKGAQISLMEAQVADIDHDRPMAHNSTLAHTSPQLLADLFRSRTLFGADDDEERNAFWSGSDDAALSTITTRPSVKWALTVSSTARLHSLSLSFVDFVGDLKHLPDRSMRGSQDETLTMNLTVATLVTRNTTVMEAPPTGTGNEPQQITTTHKKIHRSSVLLKLRQPQRDLASRMGSGGGAGSQQREEALSIWEEGVLADLHKSLQDHHLASSGARSGHHESLADAASSRVTVRELIHTSFIAPLVSPTTCLASRALTAPSTSLRDTLQAEQFSGGFLVTHRVTHHNFTTTNNGVSPNEMTSIVFPELRYNARRALTEASIARDLASKTLRVFESKVVDPTFELLRINLTAYFLPASNTSNSTGREVTIVDSDMSDEGNNAATAAVDEEQRQREMIAHAIQQLLHPETPPPREAKLPKSKRHAVGDERAQAGGGRTSSGNASLTDRELLQQTVVRLLRERLVAVRSSSGMVGESSSDCVWYELTHHRQAAHDLTSLPLVHLKAPIRLFTTNREIMRGQRFAEQPASSADSNDNQNFFDGASIFLQL